MGIDRAVEEIITLQRHLACLRYKTFTVLIGEMWMIPNVVPILAGVCQSILWNVYEGLSEADLDLKAILDLDDL